MLSILSHIVGVKHFTVRESLDRTHFCDVLVIDIKRDTDRIPLWPLARTIICTLMATSLDPLPHKNNSLLGLVS